MKNLRAQRCRSVGYRMTLRLTPGWDSCKNGRTDDRCRPGRIDVLCTERRRRRGNGLTLRRAERRRMRKDGDA